MKNQKGVTLMILVITVIMLSIILGTITYNSVSSYRLNMYYMMCSDIELLDEKIALYYLENKEIPIIEGVYLPIADLISDYQEGNVNYNPNNSGNLYQIDLTKLNNLTLKNSIYYIDEQSHTIYASNGRKIGDNIYYTVPIPYQKVEL